jgi:hypothetical protein
MTSIVGTTRMQMRIDVEERTPDDMRFHVVHAPGLGVWRSSAAGVKSYKYLKQVTNLSAPAYYRAAVRYRWLNADGRLIRGQEKHTPACLQSPPPPSEETPEAPAPPTAPSVADGTGSPTLTAG